MKSSNAQTGERETAPAIQADGLFHVIEDAFVITRCRGVLKQAKLYHRRGALYVGASGGFVRLSGNGNTSAPNLSYEEIVGFEPAATDNLGRPVYVEPARLAAPAAVRRLAAPRAV